VRQLGRRPKPWQSRSALRISARLDVARARRAAIASDVGDDQGTVAEPELRPVVAQRMA
jgi:hypothetical protein